MRLVAVRQTCTPPAHMLPQQLSDCGLLYTHAQSMLDVSLK